MIIKKRRSLISKIFSFKLFVLAGILVIVYLGMNLSKEFYRKYKIQKEIESLKKDIESFENNNYKLSQLIEYYKTDEYKEAEARKRLNLKKEGENIVIVKPAPESPKESKTEEKIDRDANLPNYKKWWNYFFASRN